MLWAELSRACLCAGKAAQGVKNPDASDAPSCNCSRMQIAQERKAAGLGLTHSSST